MWKRRSAAFRYTVLGALFGLLFPVFSTLGDVLIQQLPLTLESLIRVQAASPLHWVIDTAPFFLGLFASLAGRRQDEFEQLNQEIAQAARERQTTLEELKALQTEWGRQIADRTADLTTAVEVGKAASSILSPETLARRVVDLVRERFDLYYAGLFLLDEAGEYAVLETGTGEAGWAMKEQGHRLQVGGVSMVGAACAQRQPRIALDVGAEPVRFDNPLLPDTRSEMALPLMVGERVLGALDVQSTKPAAFSESDIAVLQLVADQVAVAVDNARRFSEEATLLEATSPLYRLSRQLTTAMSTDDVTQTILDSVAETEADGCAVARFGFSATGETDTVTFLGSWDRRGKSRFPKGVPYPARASHLHPAMTTAFWTTADVANEEQIPPPVRQALLNLGSRALVNVPLHAGTGTIGFVIVYRAAPGPFSQAAVRLYETLAEQASLALERARLLEESQQRAERERQVWQVSSRMRETLDVETVLKTAADQLYQSLGLDEVVVRLVADEQQAWAQEASEVYSTRQER